MKKIFVIGFSIFTLNFAFTQTMLSVEGSSSSINTVAKIVVNTSSDFDVIGLEVKSKPTSDKGIAGVFDGGHLGIEGLGSNIGVRGVCSDGTGIHGFAVSGKGVYGNSTSGYGIHGISFSNYGILGSSTEDIGVYGLSESSYGILGRSLGGSDGVRGWSKEGTGVYGWSEDGKGIHGSGTSDFGVYGVSDTNTGVRGHSDTGDGILGSTNDPTKYAGYFAGNVFTTGSYLPSDARLKQKEKNIENAQSLISRLRPVRYAYKIKQYKTMSLPEGQHYGLIAQELEKVFPLLVKESQAPVFKKIKIDKQQDIEEIQYEEKQVGSIDFKAVNYTGLIPILIAAAQEQQLLVDNQYGLIENQNEKIEILETKVEKLTSLVEKLNSEKERIKDPQYQLQLQQKAFLNQNQPNPFNGETQISYFLPNTVQSAHLLISSPQGQLLKTIPLEGKGQGSMAIKAEEMGNGVYYYSLKIDGRILESRQMIFTR